MELGLKGCQTLSNPIETRRGKEGFLQFSKGPGPQ